MDRFPEKRFLPRHRIPRSERHALARAIKDRLAQEPSILSASLHASFAAEDAFRDIDVGILTEPDKGFPFESDLSTELSSAFGHDVEVRLLNHAPVGFQMAVVRNGKVLFSRNEEARRGFLEHVGRRYREYVHFHNLFMDAAGAEP